MRTAATRHPLAYAIASVLAMAAMPVHAGGPQALSSAWLAQQAANRPNAQTATGNASLSGLAAQTPQQLLQQQQVQQSLANLSRAAQAVAAQMSAQRSAQQAAQQQASPVPNGLTPGGLAVAPGISSNPSLWQNANLPTQATANGQTTVQVKQTAQKAILTWNSFNVGRNTTLYFNQSGGNQTNGSSNNWIALNRVVDPSGVPSQIFGQIKAEGTVYLLNRNGILFGAGSQVNTQSLLASSLDLFSGDVAASNSAFLKGGISSGANAAVPFLVNGLFADKRSHDVVVQQGASINGGAQGFVLLAAPNVSNAGSIVDDNGQAILAAGYQFSNLSSSSTGGKLTVLNQMPTLSSSATVVPTGNTASNSGLIQSRRGQVEMLGYNVDQEGVALASTSISYPGSIVLNARDEGAVDGSYARTGALTLGSNAVTAVLPEKDGATTTSNAAATAAFTPGSISLSGNTVTFGSGSLLDAPNAKLSVLAEGSDNNPANPVAGRIYVDSGAVLDVSGLADVELPMSALLVTIPRIGQNELANAPLLRDSFLYKQKDVVIDSTQSGVAADGLSWVGSPILNVSGYVQNMPRDITQMMTNGGSIDLNGYEVLVRSGAQLNLDGGYLAYRAGWVTTPNLLGADGRVYNIAQANPNISYVGFAGTYDVVDNRWGVSTHYSNPLLAGSTRWDSGFAVGGNAGTLSIETGNALALDGQITAQAFAGRNQVINGTQPVDGTLNVTVEGAQTIYQGRGNGIHNQIVGALLQQSTSALEQLVPPFQAATPWQTVLSANDPSNSNPDDLAHWVPLSSNLVAQGGFGTFNVTTTSGAPIKEQAGTSLSVRPGGSINLAGYGVNVLGTLNAPAGSIGITSLGAVAAPSATYGNLPGNIVVGGNAVLSARGLWVNDGGASADNYVGDRYIDGGNISLATTQYFLTDKNAVPIGDATGSILLQPGSLLDVSGGGYVNGNGQLQLRNGIPDGSGGNVSLVIYVPGTTRASQFGQVYPAPSSLLATIALNGTLRAYGFSGGGTFTLQATDLQIGGSADDLAMHSGVYLAPSFFAGQGFDNYHLTSITDAIVAPGTTVQLARSSMLADDQALLSLPSGADVYATNPLTGTRYAAIGQLAPYLRYVDRNSSGTGLVVNAGSYLGWFKTPGNYAAGAVSYPDVTGSLIVGPGASIIADAGATVQLQGNASTIIDGSIQASGGSINLLTDPNQLPGLTTSTQLWLGAQAVLDVAGVSLVNPLAAGAAGVGSSNGLAPRFTPRTGTVLDGGSVLLAASGGYVLTDPHSLIDASGASDVYDLPAANAAGNQPGYVATPVWSNAGNITFAAGAGLFADGHLQSTAGASQGEGGSLQIEGIRNTMVWSRPSATAIVLQQTGMLMPSGLSPGGTVEAGGASGVLHFAADRLNGSGIASITVGPTPSSQGSPSATDVPVGVAGDLDLKLDRSFVLYAPSLTALPVADTSWNGTAPAGYVPSQSVVNITAPYVALVGTNPNQAPQAVAGSGVLNVSADFMDIGGGLDLQAWSATNLTSRGDLRFYAPTSLQYNSNTGSMQPGLLFTTGNLSLQAAQLYPVSGYAFVIDANPSGLNDAQGHALSTTLSILGSGASSVPLSAGGSLLLDADRIEQDGTVRVPSGNLAIGVLDPSAIASAFGLDGSAYPLVTTQSVHLGAGSISSVSLDGITVPFGTTTDGQQWTYNGASNQPSATLSAPPAKHISIAGNDVALDHGATIDIRGGGSLQASEWVPGVGGTVNVLAQYETSYASSAAGQQVPQYADGRAIYAIIPGYTTPVSAHDAALENGAGAGPAVGQTVYLSGMAGLPAGYYTLLPAGYATVPGAYRVVQNTSAQDSVLGQNAMLPDGTLSITGYFGSALDGSRNARTTTFLVQSAPVWQQYSQYQFTSADSYFAKQASTAGTTTPALPADAGQLSLSATQQLQLATSLDSAPASGGRASLVDIAAQAIEVTSQDASALSGYLQLSADSLSALNAGSLLLGGTRQLGRSGYQVSSIADSVVLANDGAHPLKAPEILLVANGEGDPNAQGIVLQAGSALLASGNSTADATPLIFGSVAGTAANGGSVPAVSGNGALLRVSQNGVVNVTRNDISPGATSGQLTIHAGATLQGGRSLIIDTTGDTSVSPSAVLSAQAIQADANLISFVGSDGAAAGTGGLVIGPGTLSLLGNAQQVTLNSRGAIDFLGTVAIDLPQSLNLNASAFVSDGGQVSITAAKLGLGNAIGSAATAGAGSGQLSLSANELDFTAGSSVLQGFDSVTATASQGMLGQGSGGFDFGSANVSFSTPVLATGSGADTHLVTTGAFTLNRASGTPLQDNAMGGVLSLAGGSLSIGTVVQAPAGNMNLEAAHGDLTIASGAVLNTAGVNKTFYDVTTYASGGQLKLVSDQGSVIVQQGATVDFAGAPLGGSAGGITIQAAGQAQLNGAFQGMALNGYQGGYFTLSSGGALDLDQLAQLTTQAGTTGGISISSGAGNLTLSSGKSLVAQDVYLLAGGGQGAVDTNAGVVRIDGSIDASGAAAGEIKLYGRNGVTLNGSLLATSSTPEQRGGVVVIGTTGTPDGTLNSAYGYENVQSGSAGIIQFGPNASIDVSGGSSDVGGSVSMRAPLLADGDVPIVFGGGMLAIRGASNVTIEPYAVWSTADHSSDASKHFDGLIDPAGWYQYGSDGTPQIVAGTWTDAANNALPAPADAATLKQYLSQDYFTPTAANAAHLSFYGYVNGDAAQGAGTLMSYVEQPGYSFGDRFAGLANLVLRPGITLTNPDANTNGGAISVLTNWNLGAGTTDADGVIHLAYRYGATSASASGVAPILTVQALHNVNVQASITDGFYQQNTGAALAAAVTVSDSGPPSQAYLDALAAFMATDHYLRTDAIFQYDVLWQPDPNGYNSTVYIDGFGGFNPLPISSDPYYQPILAPQKYQSADYYNNYMLYIGEVGVGNNWSLAYNNADNNGFNTYKPTQRVAPQPSTDYAGYVAAYLSWLKSTFGDAVGNTSETPSPLLLPLASEATSNYKNYTTDYATYIGGYDTYYTYVSQNDGGDVRYGGNPQMFYAPYSPAASNSTGPKQLPNVADNGPSNMPKLGSVASLVSATLLGGSSSSYRLVAGAVADAVDPVAVSAGTNTGNVNLGGHFSVQYTATGGDGKTLDFPTTVRTGTGSIAIASAGDIDWLDHVAPAVVYTAGAPASGTAAGTGVSVTNTGSNAATAMVPDFLVSGLVNPEHAGDILLNAQGNINAIEQVADTSGNVTGVAGTDISQFWWPWMQTGNAADGSRSSINFANFDQGVMSVGGNVAINAGGHISDLSVSLPTTWYANAAGNAITTVGGGNLSVHADGDILSGVYFVAKGKGELSTGGAIGADLSYTAPATINAVGGLSTPVSTLLGAQDTQWNVLARTGADIGGIYDPSYARIDPGLAGLLPANKADGQSYSATSSARLVTTQGDLILDSVSLPGFLFSYGAAAASESYNPGAVLPASLDLTALQGDVHVSGAGGLYPSATGNLSVFADGSVTFASQVYTLYGAGYAGPGVAPSFGLIDADSSLLPSPLHPLGSDAANYQNLFDAAYLDNGVNNTFKGELHQAIPLHAADATPARIYALDGDIVDGTPAPNGAMMDQLVLQPDKPALVYAGRDIVDLSFIGQQVHRSDITRIVAGRDIYDTPYYAGSLNIYAPRNLNYAYVPSILLGGVGNLMVEAGRNLGPLTSQVDIQSKLSTGYVYETGINTIGNLVNPNLPHDGANVSVLFGVAPGVDTGSFFAQYLLNHPDGMDGFASLVPDLVGFMQQWEAGKVVDTGFAQDQVNVSLTPQQAQAAFQQLPAYAQELFVQKEFFKLLAQVGADYNDPSSPYYQQYARGYAAIESLFPVSYGYTNNGAGKGGRNGEAQTVDTGDLDIRSSTIQTQQGGDVSILGPGGQALIGSVNAPPLITNSEGQVLAGPNSMGVLTLEQGSVDMFTDRSVLLAQSRIFTEQGGDMVIWSSNGDINAGQGAKTVAEIPPPTYVCDVDAFCLIDARGQVSGAGIATLQTLPGAPTGSVYLVAPRGTVDAGDAGIRVSGNLIVAAAQVLNADNIQVQGQKIGVPVAQTVNVGALSAAGAAAGAVSKVAQDMANQQKNDALGKQPSVISVQVLGFGDGSTSIQGSGYNPNSPVQVLGAGPLSDARKRVLTDAERRQLSE
ncbi:filamentous haemagglutinin family protein [Dyella sp.]|uniref:filamentous haemagglutinin family protein n=1 Tax=Dyella sp. TaxID=1869338 RepID=UPI002D7A3085|nr:filamentous haemagglutinin family protein [Dyella sp.]HET7332469.1 filamentous hemagglutinin family protein [Dyella sp.]